MKERSQDQLKKALKPYRIKIDKLDEKLLKLLGERFGIVRKVAQIKIDNDFPAFIGDRVDEVRENAVRIGGKYGIDPDFIRTLYTMIIYQSCATEDLMKHAARKAGKKKK